MTQRKFTDIPISTWLQIGTLLVVLGISYATMVSSNEALSAEQTKQAAELREYDRRLRVLENQWSRTDERILNLTASVNDVKAEQQVTNDILRRLLENMNR